MLRVGLTGELGSGKSAVAQMLAARGAVVLSSDEMARAMMQPPHPVYQAIVNRFGPTAVLPDGQLDRTELARLAFNSINPRVEELNAIVHPAVLAEQERQLADLARKNPEAIAVIESALIFATKHAGGDHPWHDRFDRILLVSAPDDLKIERFVRRVAGKRPLSDAERASIRADALARLATQRISPVLCPECITIQNTGDLAALEQRVHEVFQELRCDAVSSGE